ncbi:hypothetical protein AURDEDRAFT_176681 [Auricularia subglabra TFB-10046 SS5]|uniref:Ubiquitin-like protease family profile domain-containing protein n=1 Tax=Auricularia subglabra (strain TFB-10046 / SS5) TaxID=717982 RepID=J0LCM9_AURST|nr:hypothetical protein AURDEDRAFT_176681 [Auricularia subglabra TFB-10046 SS5]
MQRRTSSDQVVDDSDSEDDDEIEEIAALPSLSSGSRSFADIDMLGFVQTLPTHIHHWADLNALAAAADTSTPTHDLWAPAHASFPRSKIEPVSWKRIPSGHRWLNDEAINIGISVIAREYSTFLDRFGALPSYEITSYIDGLAIPELHRRVRKLRPWEREAIIVPVNEDNAHWTMALVWPRHGYIEVFDSLARKQRVATFEPLALRVSRGLIHRRSRRQHRTPPPDLTAAPVLIDAFLVSPPASHKVSDALGASSSCGIAQLVYRYFRAVSDYARTLGEDVPVMPAQWKARPMVDGACQTNGSDCRLWTLSSVAAILSGNRVTSLQEADMPRVRRALCTLIRRYCSEAVS